MSKIEDLQKKLRAMKIRGSKSLLLDVEYITELLDEIQAIEEKVDERSESSETTNITSRIIHGGKFQ